MGDNSSDVVGEFVGNKTADDGSKQAQDDSGYCGNIVHDSSDTSAYVDNEDRPSVNLSISHHENESSCGYAHGAESMGLDLSEIRPDYSDDKTFTRVTTIEMNPIDSQDDEPNNVSGTTTKKRKGKDRLASNKRRKVLYDGSDTELSNDHIRSMLADTRDVMQTSLTNLSKSESFQDVLDDDKPVCFGTSNLRREIVMASSKIELLFVRPALGDDGQLSSKLLELWFQNTSTVLGKPFLYELHHEDEYSKEESRIPEATNESTTRTSTSLMSEIEDEENGIENARQFDVNENEGSPELNINQHLEMQQVEQQTKGNIDAIVDHSNEFEFQTDDRVDDGNAFVIDESNTFDEREQTPSGKKNEGSTGTGKFFYP